MSRTLASNVWWVGRMDVLDEIKANSAQLSWSWAEFGNNTQKKNVLILTCILQQIAASKCRKCRRQPCDLTLGL